MGRKGPRGATVERQVEVKETLTWRFTADELRARLSLPGDAVLQVVDEIGDGIATNVELTGLIARSVQVRTPKRAPAESDPFDGNPDDAAGA